MSVPVQVVSVPCCPYCAGELELVDTWDENPPIPYRAWPQRWSVHNGDGGTTTFCPRCGEDLDPVEIAVAAGHLPEYPWRIAGDQDQQRERPS